MSWFIKTPFVLATFGTSLTTGRLSTFWPERLREVLNAVPEAVGPIIIQNMGRGSQNSDWGVANAPLIADLNPTHILTEGFAINDAASGIGVSQAQHLLNMQAMHDIWKARNPAVDITWQTMNGVSTSGAALRPDLAAYYADEVTKAQAMGDRILDHYAGGAGYPVPPGFAGGWVKPLPDYLTNAGDGLHPIWEGAVDTYMWPATLYWLRCRMAEFWGLEIPDPPEPPPIPDTDYLLVGGGGSGGPYVGGGGGAGGVKRGKTNLTDLYGPVSLGVGGAAAPSTTGVPGNPGTATTLGPFTANGGGYGGGYGGTAPASNGGGGASGGGGGVYTSPWPGGAGIIGQGNSGGFSNGSNGGGGGGGGYGGPGADAAPSVAGVGGPGYVVDVPGLSLTVAGGGPGGGYTYSRPAYAAGQGPTNYGGGGFGGGNGGGSTTASDAGGHGTAWVWYAGAPQAKGGDVSSFGGFTIHHWDAQSLNYRPALMTSNTLPAGNVASASDAGGGAAYLSFNGANSNCWLATSSPIASLTRQIPAAKVYNRYVITPWATLVQMATGWTLEGSNDGVAWTTLDTQAGVTWPTTAVRTYDFANTVAFAYYRWTTTGSGNGVNVTMGADVRLENSEYMTFSAL